MKEVMDVKNIIQILKSKLLIDIKSFKNHRTRKMILLKDIILGICNIIAGMATLYVINTIDSVKLAISIIIIVLESNYIIDMLVINRIIQRHIDEEI